MPDRAKGLRVRDVFRYGYACAAVVAALLFRQALVRYLGVELPPFLLFYPTILVLALLAGLWPGVLATVLSALLIRYWIFSEPGHLAAAGVGADAIVLAIFFVMGVLVCVVAERYRQVLLHDERRFRSIFENMAEGMSYCKMLLDDEGRAVDFVYLEVNHAFNVMTGLKNVEGKRLSQMVPNMNQVNPELLETYGRVVRTGQPERFEIYREPLRKWLSILAYCMKGEYFVAVLQDITEHKRAEERIAHLASFPEMNPGFVFETDLEGNLTYFNPAVARQFPTLRDAGVEHPLLQDWPKIIASLKEDGKQSIHREIAIDGLTLLQTVSYVPKVKTVRSYCADITELKQAELELIHAREVAEAATLKLASQNAILDRERAILRTFIDNVPDLLFVKDVEGRFMLANPEVARWAGVKSSEEMLGKTDFEFFPLEHSIRCRDDDMSVIRSGRAIVDREETVMSSVTHEVAYLLTTKVPLFDSYGHAIGLAGITRNMTKRKHAEEETARLHAQLQQSQKLEAVGQLAGGIAHDFNNLLMVIMAQTELLGLEVKGTAAKRVEDVMKSARRAAELTGQLLAFSRKQPTQPMATSMNRLVGGMSDMLQRLVGEDLDFKVALCDEPWMVKIDRQQFEQVIMNLVVNARDAMPGGGRLTIETANVTIREEYIVTHPLVSAGDYAMLAVTDSGMGMSAETQSRLFEPFFTTKEPGKGTGLGLPMVYGIVKQSGGFIWVYSELGKGTCFKIYLPKTKLSEAALPEGSAPPMPSIKKKAKILVVEDEDNLRNVISEFLLLEGHTVIAAGTVEDAYRAALDGRMEIELLLTDVVLKGGNGKQLVHRLEEQGCMFPVIYMSGYTPNVIVHHGVMEPGTLFLQKPFSRLRLLDKVEEALAARG
jgi:PAS domain S-box-containing protein